MLVSKEAQRTQTTQSPILLTPSKVKKMLDRRQQVQVVKFRTTVADCVPNM
jgi:hypothetical protein